MKYHLSSFGDFRCAHCHMIVPAVQLISGVNNRNHCPYCLWSCHLDLYTAGDRLSACKALMKPIGLTMKKSRNKYRLEARGELMLIHECVECKTLSINRSAADDLPDRIMEIFQTSFSLSQQIRITCRMLGIEILKLEDMELLHVQLYGKVQQAP